MTEGENSNDPNGDPLSPAGKLYVTSTYKGASVPARILIGGFETESMTYNEIGADPETFQISVKADGYLIPPEKTVTITSGVRTSVDFTLQKDYVFGGFTSPIISNDYNGGTAGKAIPLKWHLSDTAGQNIDDPASFVSVNSYKVSCGVFPGTPVLPIIEDYTGSSGLKNTEGGWYQFNWNTNKTYAKTCRNMYILFNNGQKSTVYAFKF
jgi:hypothetical protein